jgi:hypothetical protein
MHHFNFRIPSPQELQEGDASDEVPMSPDEAFAAFAFAAACASGGGFGDMAESLFWAQHLGACSNQSDWIFDAFSFRQVKKKLWQMRRTYTLW